LLDDMILGVLLTLATSVLHGLATAGLITFLRGDRFIEWFLRTIRARVALIALLVLSLFLVSVFEAGVWGAVYVKIGAIADFEEALYFSVVTFTTLGYGDITLSEDWRLLGSFQAANGVIVFGWTTALIVAAIQQMTARPAGS
jgi:voltage-gated potassium channel Kch